MDPERTISEADELELFLYDEDDDEHPRHSVEPEDTIADPYVPLDAA